LKFPSAPSGATTPSSVLLHFVRDGSAEDADGRCIGQTDLQLSAIGRSEIRILSRHLPAPPFRFISSDLDRARQTANLLTSAQVTSEPRLREMHFGEWEGKTWARIEEEEPGDGTPFAEYWPSIRPPGGECFEDVIARVRAWLDSLPRNVGDFIVVAHSGSIRAAATILLGLPASRAFALALDHGSLSTFELSPHGASLIRWNASGL
jgi:alpha-ribazole phosphatase